MNIESLLNKLGLTSDSKQTGKDIVIRCRTGTHFDNNPSCHVNREKGLWYCFSCSKGGNIIDLICLSLGCNKSKAKLILAGYDVTSPRIIKEKKKGPLKDFPYELTPISEDKSKDFIKYLRDSRKIRNIDSIKDRLGFSYIDQGRWAGRLIIPILLHGECWGLVGRAIGNKQPPYLYNTGFPRRECLYNPMPVTGANIAFLVEGVFDWIAMYFAGLLPCYSVLGSDVSQEQVNVLVNDKIDTVYTVFDGDKAGYKAASGFYEKYSEIFSAIYLVALPLKKDPHDINAYDLISICMNTERMTKETYHKWLLNLMNGECVIPGENDG